MLDARRIKAYSLDGQRLRERLQVLTQPLGKLDSLDAPRRQIEHDAFLITDRRIDLGAVQNEERLHGGMANALVAIEESVALDQGKGTAPLPSPPAWDTSRLHQSWPWAARWPIRVRRGPGSRRRHPSLGAVADAARRPPPA